MHLLTCLWMLANENAFFKSNLEEKARKEIPFVYKKQKMTSKGHICTTSCKLK